MARYPRAIWKPVTRYQPGGSSHQPMAAHRRFMLHTAVSNGDSLFELFNTPGNAVAHFYVRRDGTIEQYVDTNTRSSACLDGNPDSITVESWDGYPHGWANGSDVPAWTEEQLAAIAALAAWVNVNHGIPLVACPNSRPGSTGVAWHRQGIDGNFPPGLLSGRVPGGEHWSSSAGKVCPGDRRIRQISDVIALTRSEEDPMPEPVDLWRHKIREDGTTAADALRRSQVASEEAAQLLREQNQLLRDIHQQLVEQGSK